LKTDETILMQIGKNSEWNGQLWESEGQKSRSQEAELHVYHENPFGDISQKLSDQF